MQDGTRGWNGQGLLTSSYQNAKHGLSLNPGLRESPRPDLLRSILSICVFSPENLPSSSNYSRVTVLGGCVIWKCSHVLIAQNLGKCFSWNSLLLGEMGARNLNVGYKYAAVKFVCRPARTKEMKKNVKLFKNSWRQRNKNFWDFTCVGRQLVTGRPSTCDLA